MSSGRAASPMKICKLLAASCRTSRALLIILPFPSSASSSTVEMRCKSIAKTSRSRRSQPLCRRPRMACSKSGTYSNMPGMSPSSWWQFTTRSSSSIRLPLVVESLVHSTLSASAKYSRASGHLSRRTMQWAMVPACQPASGFMGPKEETCSSYDSPKGCCAFSYHSRASSFFSSKKKLSPIPMATSPTLERILASMILSLASAVRWISPALTQSSKPIFISSRCWVFWPSRACALPRSQMSNQVGCTPLVFLTSTLFRVYSKHLSASSSEE
mmetsp:Transcript_137736/g.326305  ORF Transcript_137736/g.326305 Transcript_137736/m.326305 type:complete len:272 (+) Transcript_137736:386-1201(+)